MVQRKLRPRIAQPHVLAILRSSVAALIVLAFTGMVLQSNLRLP